MEEGLVIWNHNCFIYLSPFLWGHHRTISSHDGTIRIISLYRQVTPVDDNVKPTEEQDDGSDKGQSVPAAMFMPTPLPGYGYQRSPAPHPGGFSFPPQPMMPFPGGVFPHMHQPYGYAPMGMPVPAPGKKADGAQACTVHLPGLPQPFDVPFPARKLPVCIRCKKNYRSRELCRQRDEHKALPWQTVYVIVTLTDEVLEKGEDGKLSVADIPVVAELQETPDMCRGPADGFMSKQPICKICKEKNYTRDYCRDTSKHTTPPYQAVYVKLVPKSVSTDVPRPFKKKKRKQEENAEGRPMQDSESPDNHNEEGQSDDLTEIHQSRTIFAEVSVRTIIVKVSPDSLKLVFDSLLLTTALTLSLLPRFIHSSGANKSSTPKCWTITLRLPCRA